MRDDDISDLRSTIVPKLDQVNAEMLLGGPMTITVTSVTRNSSAEQPLSIHYDGEDGRPYKPCLTMRKLLVFAWGENGHDWVDRSMTLFNDPRVKWGGVEVGGIRISHLSHINGDIKVSLASTRGKKDMHIVKLLEVPPAPTLEEVLKAIASATNKAGMDAAKSLAMQLDGDDLEKAQSAYMTRVKALRSPTTSTTTGDQSE